MSHAASCRLEWSHHVQAPDCKGPGDGDSLECGSRQVLLGAEKLALLTVFDQLFGAFQSSQPEETMMESFGDKESGGRVVAALALMNVPEDCSAFFGSTQRWKTPVTLRLTSSLFTIVYAAARRCTCRARISSTGSSLLTRKLRMGWAHDGAVTSSVANTATATRVG